MNGYTCPCCRELISGRETRTCPTCKATPETQLIVWDRQRAAFERADAERRYKAEERANG